MSNGASAPSISQSIQTTTMTASIALEKTDEVQVLLESDLTQTEWTTRQADELAIQLAGKDRFEKALIIGEKLSSIYNSGSFRRSRPGGERWSWDDWVTNRLSLLLPGEELGVQAADDRRFLWEVRKLLVRSSSTVELPKGLAHARALKALIPRQYDRLNSWNPSVLDDEEKAKGLALVWEKAQDRAKEQQRKNGPTCDDVRITREQWRKQLELAGQIRQQPSSLKAATEARRELASKTVDTTAQTVAPFTKGKQEDFESAAQPDMDDAQYQPPRYTAEELKEQAQRSAERQRQHQQKVEQKQVREAIERPDREAAAELEKYYKQYSDALAGTMKALRELRSTLSTIATVKGTIYLDELRECEGPLGFNYITNDIKELQGAKDMLLEIVKLATSREGPQTIDWGSVDVTAEAE